MRDDDGAGADLSAIDRRLLFRAGLGLLTLGVLPEVAGCGPSGSTASPAASPTSFPTLTTGGGAIPTSGPVSGAAHVLSTGPVSGGLRPVYVDVARVRVGLNQPGALDAVVSGMRDFATHLHGVSATARKNWTVSPLSIAVAVGMLRAGAQGTTAAQLDSAFGFPRTSAPEGSPHAAFNALTAALLTTPGSRPPGGGTGTPPPVVALANGLFVADGSASRLRPAYLALLAQQYGAHATAVDFTSNNAVDVINAWVSKQTRGRIRSVFDQIDPATLLVLANAVYLKASWDEQFDKSQTRTSAFRTASGATVDVPMMRSTLEYAGYASGAVWQRVTMTYAGGDLSMRIVVPHRVVTDAAALRALVPVATARDRSYGQGIPSDVSVDLRLPRWNTSTDLDLRSVLTRLGVTDVFDQFRSDLDGIAGHIGLYVDQAVHKANVTVDEKGTVAAAVTAFGATTASARRVPPRTVHVHADRPFVWAIVHEPTGTPVFTGHVVDPTR